MDPQPQPAMPGRDPAISSARDKPGVVALAGSGPAMALWVGFRRGQPPRPAGIRAKLHILPVPRPFLTPCERSARGDADLLRQVEFLVRQQRVPLWPTCRPWPSSSRTRAPSGPSTHTASRPSTPAMPRMRLPAGSRAATSGRAAPPPARWISSTTSVTVPATISTPIPTTKALSAPICSHLPKFMTSLPARNMRAAAPTVFWPTP